MDNSDEPVVHRIEDPVFAQIRQVLSGAGWEEVGDTAFVLGMGLDLRYANGTATIDVGWVNDGLRLHVKLPRSPTHPAAKAEFEVAVADVEEFLRLVLDWQDRLDPHRFAWFAAELAVIAAGTTVSMNGDGQGPVPTLPGPPPVESCPPAARQRATRLTEVLGTAGWTVAVPRHTPLLTSLVALEIADGSGERWQCEYVLTGLPELTEALRLGVTGTVTDDEDPTAYLRHLGEPVDILVDLTGVGEPATVVGDADLLDEVLGRLLAGFRAERTGDALRAERTLAGVGLAGALVAPSPLGLIRRHPSAITTDRLERRPARPLAEVTADLNAAADDPARADGTAARSDGATPAGADGTAARSGGAAPAGADGTAAGSDGELWLDAAFAGYDAGRWRLAVRAFRQASRIGAGDGLADLWLGALLFNADPAEAHAALDRAARAGRTPAYTRNLQADLCLHLGDEAGEIAALRQATVEAPEHADSWARYGLSLAKAGRPAEAIEPLDRALRLCDDPMSRWYRGYAHLLAGDRAAALDDLARAVELDPALAAEIYQDPDHAPLRGEPRFEALAEIPRTRLRQTQDGLRELLTHDGWRESTEGELQRYDEDFDGEIFTVFPVEEDGTVVLDIDDGVSGIMLVQVDLAGDPAPFVDVLRRWPAEFADDPEGWVEVNALVEALVTAYPKGVCYRDLGSGWIPVGG